MIFEKLENGWTANIVQVPAELPDLSGTEFLFADFETSGLFPYSENNNAHACGLAVLSDDSLDAYYVPFRHRDKEWNLPLEAVREWLQTILQVPNWVNHNWKFDAHFLHKEGITYKNKAYDTLALSMLIDSDRYSHELKVLMREWCGLSTDEETEIKARLRRIFRRKDDWDYSALAGDFLGKYACKDVFGNRELWRYILKHKDPELDYVWDLEVKLTQALFRMERRGLRIDRAQVAQEHLDSIYKKVEAEGKIFEHTQREFVNSSKALRDIICLQLGLPILEWNWKRLPTGEYVKTGPSFDKRALKQYALMPTVRDTPSAKETIESITVAREEATYQQLFLDPCLEHESSAGLIHPSYRQIIRTGRMSTAKPCIHQFNARAKNLIHAKPGRELAAWDASQIEFRFIVHYIEDPLAIAAYREDPKTDFHTWVAEVCGIDRKSAKNINFAIAFNAGKKRVTKMLALNDFIVEQARTEIVQHVDSREVEPADAIRVFEKLCEIKATEIYQRYHERLPGIRVLTKYSAKQCKLRGYIRTAFGRRRHIHPDFAYKAFNSAVQGSAMDFIKTRIVALDEDERLQKEDIYPVISTHDQIVFDGPAGAFDSALTRNHITRILETQPIPFAVPFLWTFEGIALSGLPRKGAVRFPDRVEQEMQEDSGIKTQTLTGP